ncbi:MAG TPA: aminodeoxychorismate lyase, partial [Gammaproteobacteria bacterium]|nr:aminodeoxychorismate lyase [Gammaproteobacteria bacterium]
PIALVGRAALEAAAHPAPGRAVFFVSRGDGTHVFSETLEEHNRAVNCYQRRLCRGDAP